MKSKGADKRAMHSAWCVTMGGWLYHYQQPQVPNPVRGRELRCPSGPLPSLGVKLAEQPPLTLSLSCSFKVSRSLQCQTATRFQAETSSGSRCGEICSHNSSWRCWTACLRGSTTQTSSPPRSPSNRSRYAAHDSCPPHLLPQRRHGPTSGLVRVSLFAEWIFHCFLAKPGWSPYPTRPGGLAGGL